MVLYAFLFLIFVLAVISPLVRKARERALAERLKNIRDPHEAMIAVDNAMRANRSDGDFFAKLRESYFFWR